MMNRKHLLLILLGLSLIISYLSLTTQLANHSPLPASASSLPPLEFTGKLVYVPQERGFYGIESDTGKKYVPLNLADLLKQQNLPLQDGLRVQVKAEKNEHTLGIQLWGEYINLLHLSAVNNTGEVTTIK